METRREPAFGITLTISSPVSFLRRTAEANLATAPSLSCPVSLPSVGVGHV